VILQKKSVNSYLSNAIGSFANLTTHQSIAHRSKYSLARIHKAKEEQELSDEFNRLFKFVRLESLLASTQNQDFLSQR
jgi:hypothetical protein